MAKRQKKTTRQQYEYLLRFVKENRILLSGKTKPVDAQKVEQLWEEFGDKMNNLYGPIKTAMQWKRVFIEWKVNTKRKSRSINSHLQSTGVKSSKILTDLEKQLLNSISKIHSGEPLLEDEVLPVDLLVIEEKPVLEQEHDYVIRRPDETIPPIPPPETMSTGTPKDIKTTPRKSENATTNEYNKESAQKQSNPIKALADAINNFAEVYKLQAEASLLMAKVKREKVKIEHFKTFGHLENFEL